MKKVWTIILAGLLFLTTSGRSSAAVIQAGFLLDGSGSISAAEFNLIRQGVADGIQIIPTNSTVELSVVQFATGTQVVVTPTLINSAATLTAVTNQILGMKQLGGGTALDLGITAITKQITGSGQFKQPDTSSLINIVTDGVPNSQPLAVAARNASLAAGIDRIAAEAVDAPAAAVTFLRDGIVAPQPGVLAPPFPATAGFVVVVDSFDDFAPAIRQKIQTAIVDPVIPEPSSIVLFGLGVVALVGYGFRRARKQAA